MENRSKRVEEMTTDEAIAYLKARSEELYKKLGSQAYTKGSATPNVSYAPTQGGLHPAPMNNGFGW